MNFTNAKHFIKHSHWYIKPGTYWYILDPMFTYNFPTGFIGHSKKWELQTHYCNYINILFIFIKVIWSMIWSFVKKKYWLI